MLVQDLILNVLELCCQSCGVHFCKVSIIGCETSESRFIMTCLMHSY